MIRSPRLRLSALLVAALVVLTLLLVACGGSATPSASPTADPVAGVVNGHDLNASDVGVVLAERRLLGQSAAGAFKEAVDRELVRQEAARLGVTAGTALIDKRIADLTTQEGGAAALTKALAAAKTTPAQLRQSITDGVLRQAVQDALFPKLEVGPAAVRAYYHSHVKDLFTRAASVHLAAIPVRARLIAENALKRLRQGHPFAEVARQFSIDPESKANGGDMGWVHGRVSAGGSAEGGDRGQGGRHGEAGRGGRWLVRARRDRDAAHPGDLVRQSPRRPARRAHTREALQGP